MIPSIPGDLKAPLPSGEFPVQKTFIIARIVQHLHRDVTLHGCLDKMNN